MAVFLGRSFVGSYIRTFARRISKAERASV